MIDFYKHGFLSILGKNARTMSENIYIMELITQYDEYLKKAKAQKEKYDKIGYNNTDFYL